MKSASLPPSRPEQRLREDARDVFREPWRDSTSSVSRSSSTVSVDPAESSSSSPAPAVAPPDKSRGSSVATTYSSAASNDSLVVAFAIAAAVCALGATGSAPTMQKPPIAPSS